ncbi:uncharacterized protein B0H18DRAFT_1120447 [Fomitopsis serialis]|uniref:uncharacterized protein n=1 Tax=Fomitopsis serialis TaxID=139415 RepID=UPI002007F67D|nr:uncharacterized protein B0H18DRAFT_1120447 [Neoantrodia serialis]KAH9923346.1 hypothetical protein B0H18DRAFT_1120447 [Neoantrodia serialis]
MSNFHKLLNMILTSIRRLPFFRKNIPGVAEVLFRGHVDDAKLHFSRALMQHDHYELWDPGQLTVARLTGGPYIILVEPDEDYPPILRVPFRLIPNEMVITVNQSELTIFGEVPDNEDEFLHIKAGDDKTLWVIAQCLARHTADVERRERNIRAQIMSFRLFLFEDSEERRSRVNLGQKPGIGLSLTAGNNTVDMTGVLVEHDSDIELLVMGEPYPVLQQRNVASHYKGCYLAFFRSDGLPPPDSVQVECANQPHPADFDVRIMTFVSA